MTDANTHLHSAHQLAIPTEITPRIFLMWCKVFFDKGFIYIALVFHWHEIYIRVNISPLTLCVCSNCVSLVILLTWLLFLVCQPSVIHNGQYIQNLWNRKNYKKSNKNIKGNSFYVWTLHSTKAKHCSDNKITYSIWNEFLPNYA